MQIGILPPDLKSIEQLFAGGANFSVPRYQRSFAWSDDETEELWEDVLGAVQRSGEYFIGTIVLQRTNAQAQEIIDGQQRLACITMLFSAIRNFFMAAADNREQQIELAFLGSRGFDRNAPLTPKLSLNKYAESITYGDKNIPASSSQNGGESEGKDSEGDGCSASPV